MSIKVSCPHCERSYTVAETQEGKTLRCKECKETFVAQVGRSPRREPEEEEERPRRRSAARDEEDEERPRRRRKKGGVPLWVWLAGGGGALLVLLIIVVVIAVIKLGGGGNAGGGLGGLLGGDSLTLENFLKLRYGMAKAEVVAIFGPPPEDPVPTMTVWSRMSGDVPEVSLSTQFENGKLVHAELVRFTVTGKTPDGKKKILDPEILGILDDKGARAGSR
jgi:predicted Zn finger-like uncharacterized protein